MIYLSRNSERCKIFHGILKNPYYVDSAKVTAILCMYVRTTYNAKIALDFFLSAC